MRRALVLCWLLLSACGADSHRNGKADTPTDGGDSGASSSGGAASTGGTGGRPATGGATTTGGAMTTGGAGGVIDASATGGTDGGNDSSDASGDAANGLDGCVPPSKLPDLTSGAGWLICDALDTASRNWTGLMTFTSVVPGCNGAAVAGTFHWVVEATGQTGDTIFEGSFNAATGIIDVEERDPVGSVVSSHDTMHYDTATDTLTDGAWTCSCPAGSWSTATRRADIDAGTVCRRAR